MMSPLSPSSCRTGDTEVIEYNRSDNLRMIFWVFEPDQPSPLSIHISSKINQISTISILVYNPPDAVDQKSLSYPSKLENTLSKKLYISTFSENDILPSDFFSPEFRSPISQTRESTSDRRIKVSISLSCNLECYPKHRFTVIIEYTLSSGIQGIEPVSGDKSRIFFLKCS